MNLVVQAIQYLNEALVIAQINGFKQDEIDTLRLLGEIYTDNERHPEAVDCYHKGLLIAQETGDKKQKHAMCIGLGQAYDLLGHCSDSMEYSEMALHIAIDAEDSDMIAKSYLNLGKAFSIKYDYQNSIKYLNKAIDIFEHPDNNSERDLIQCYGKKALVYSKQGKYHYAIHLQEECLKIAVNLNNERLQANILNNLGTIHVNLNNYEEAFEVYLQCLAIAERISSKTTLKSCYANLANISRYSRDYQNVDSVYQESLEIAREMNDKKGEAVAIFLIGDNYYLREKYVDALQYFNDSLTIARDIDAKDLEASVYGAIGRIHFDTEKFKEAISMYEISLAIASSIGDKEKEWKACSQLGLTYYFLGHQSQDHKEHINYLSKSEVYLRQALDCYDYLLTHLHHRDQFKISKFDQFTETYNLLTSVLIETKQTEEALLVSDQGRARALGDQLKLQYGVSQSEDFYSKPLTHPDVKSVVSNDAFTLLHYSLLNECLVLWILSKDSIKFKELDKEEFVSAVESLYIEQTKDEDMEQEDEETCENRSLDDCMTPTDQQCDDETECVTRASNSGAELNVHALEKLYNTLIAPVISDVQHDEVVIVPDGKMYTIPFAALKDPNTGNYLSESKRIRLVPSIAVLKLLQECPVDHHSQKGALIVGNPNVGEVKCRGKLRLFQSLMCAQKEARAVAEVIKEGCEYRKLQLNITLLTETEATKDVVLAKIKEEIGIIHIAAHGDADFGEIVLAPITSQDRQGLPEEQDCLLTMREVQEAGVKAQLVVLSCCHSGRGEIRAEGMIGLSRAFIAAGARAVVASLWDISDKATYGFMVKFYEYLCLYGKSASVSLNKAVEYLRDRSIYKEPKYWAPFVLIGDDIAINFKQDS